MTIHRIKLKDLNAQFIQQLRAQYTDQELEIAFWLSSKPINKSAHKHLSEENWSINIPKNMEKDHLAIEKESASKKLSSHNNNL